MKFGKSIVTDSLVLHIDAANKKSYPGSGTAINDLSGNSINGTLKNGPVFNSGNVGHIAFDGTNDYVFMEGVPTANFMTLECWFRTDTQQSNKYIVAFGKDLTGQNGFDLTFQNTQIGSYIATTGAGGGGNLYTTSYYDNIWHHIASTYDGSICKTYYDGNHAVSRTGMSGIPDIESTGRLNIGSWVNNGVNANSDIATVSIYNRALTADEILQNFNATKARFGL